MEFVGPVPSLFVLSSRIALNSQNRALRLTTWQLLYRLGHAPDTISIMNLPPSEPPSAAPMKYCITWHLPTALVPSMTIHGDFFAVLECIKDASLWKPQRIDFIHMELPYQLIVGIEYAMQILGHTSVFLINCTYPGIESAFQAYRMKQALTADGRATMYDGGLELHRLIRMKANYRWKPSGPPLPNPSTVPCTLFTCPRAPSRLLTLCCRAVLASSYESTHKIAKRLMLCAGLAPERITVHCFTPPDGREYSHHMTMLMPNMKEPFCRSALDLHTILSCLDRDSGWMPKRIDFIGVNFFEEHIRMLEDIGCNERCKFRTVYLVNCNFWFPLRHHGERERLRHALVGGKGILCDFNALICGCPCVPPNIGVIFIPNPFVPER